MIVTSEFDDGDFKRHMDKLEKRVESAEDASELTSPALRALRRELQRKKAVNDLHPNQG